MKFFCKTIKLLQPPPQIPVIRVFANTYSKNSGWNFDETIRIPVPASKKGIELHNIWLRHHCPCEQCYNPKTFQKMLIPSHLPHLCVIKDLSTCVKTNSVQIIWSDDHKSSFKIDWLQKVSSKIRHLSETNSNFLTGTDQHKYNYNYTRKEKPPSDPLSNAINYEDFMSPDNKELGVAKLLENIVKHGYGIVSNAPPDFNSTKQVVLRISQPQNTLFGDFSEWTSNLSHADTAYTSGTVHHHTDTSYFSEPMGLQMFHCLKHDGTGGMNSLVDGFEIARKLYETSPSNHFLLSRIPVPSHYLDTGNHEYYSVDTTLKHNLLTGTIERFRYNPHDMATLDTVPFDKMGAFYQSLVLLSDEIESSPIFLKLSPGIIIFLDNWRILHGRSAFSGFRHLCGTYISRSDWLSKARVLGVELW